MSIYCKVVNLLFEALFLDKMQVRGQQLILVIITNRIWENAGLPRMGRHQLFNMEASKDSPNKNIANL
jgi:hypothetical protein